MEQSGSCPEDTTPCIESASSKNKLCYPPSEHESSCPITDVNIISGLPDLQYMGTDYESMEFGNNTIYYSRTVDSLPISQMRMDSQPCLDPWQ